MDQQQVHRNFKLDKPSYLFLLQIHKPTAQKKQKNKFETKLPRKQLMSKKMYLDITEKHPVF